MASANSSNGCMTITRTRMPISARHLPMAIMCYSIPTSSAFPMSVAWLSAKSSAWKTARSSNTGTVSRHCLKRHKIPIPCFERYMPASLPVYDESASSGHTGERRNGAWQAAPGLLFADRQRLDAGDWVADHAEATGNYQFYVQAQGHSQCGEFNGLPQHGWCPPGALQLLRPDELVFPAGAGPTRFLHVTISPGFLAQQLA